MATTSSPSLPDIQFDIGAFVHPAQTIAGVLVDFGVVYTFLAPAALTRNPTKADQLTLAAALATIDEAYPFSPSGVFTFVAYGLPYFNRLPASLVAASMPRLTFDTSRFALEEAVPGPTDVSPFNPGISKRLYNVPVQIESNDLLFTLRSDSLANIAEVSAWFNGSDILNSRVVPSPRFNGLFNFKTPRLNFVQPGLPRKLADINNFSFAAEINPASSMWMGFVDQQVAGSSPSGATVTFAGTSSAVLTTAKPGDYFDNGSVQHLSHVIDDLAQFYSTTAADPEPFSERILTRSTASDIWPACNARAGQVTGPRCTYATTDPGCPRKTYRTAPRSRRSNSPCSSRPPSSSACCGSTRPRSITSRPVSKAAPRPACLLASKRRLRRRRARALHPGDPPPELPGPAQAPPCLPAARADLTHLRAREGSRRLPDGCAEMGAPAPGAPILHVEPAVNDPRSDKYMPDLGTTCHV